MATQELVRTNVPHLWDAPRERKYGTYAFQFINKIVSKYGPLPPSRDGKTATVPSQVMFEQLHKWSVDNPPYFWSELYDFLNIIGDPRNPLDPLVKYGKHPRDTDYLPHVKFSIAENMLRNYQSDEVAVISWGENVYRETATHKELYARASVLAQALKATGFKKGERAVGIFPVTINALVAKLAVNSLGGVWSCCSPDFGVNGLVDRFGQITPKVIFTCDFYLYKGVVFETQQKAKDLMKLLPTVHTLVVFPYCNSPPMPVSSPAISLADFTAKYSPKKIDYVRLNANDPALILYSSGTTGLPKCFLLRNASLIQLMKEQILHLDLKPGGRNCHLTNTGWMLWNWILSSFVSNMTIALFDGNPFYPTPDVVFKFAAETKLSYLGLSPKYLLTVKNYGVKNIHKKYDLSKIRVIASAGSPLSASLHEFVYEHVKNDVHVVSFSGGTDVMACFLQGNPLGPVYAGQLQTLSLGMDVKIFNDDGKEDKIGELVCYPSFCSHPIKFMGDEDGERLRKAYYKKFPLYWAHGDILENTSTNNYIIHGRSDTTLNPGGVRIGTAEIYRVIETMKEIVESAAVGCQMQDDVYIFLFVVMNEGYKFDQEMKAKINSNIKKYLTPRHIPYLLVAVPELPVTKTGKVSELAIRDVLHHKPVKNLAALDNPECLQEFTKYAPPLQSKF